LQHCALGDSLGLIEPQQTGRDFSLRRKRFNDRPGDAKVIRPPVQPRMKKAGDFSCIGVDGCDVGSLIAIAEYAAQSQIVQVGTTAVFPAYDVINLMRKCGASLGIQTVLATGSRAKADFSP
jgi:hypothetical protein